MSEIPDVIGGEVITAAGYNTRTDRIVQRYQNVAARDASILVPVNGDLAYLLDSQLVTVFNGVDWQDLMDSTGGTFTGPVNGESFSTPGDAAIMNEDGSFECTTLHSAGRMTGGGVVTAQTRFDSLKVPDNNLLATLVIPDPGYTVGADILVIGVGGFDAAAIEVGFDLFTIPNQVQGNVVAQANLYATIFASGSLNITGGTSVQLQAVVPGGGSAFFKGTMTATIQQQPDA